MTTQNINRRAFLGTSLLGAASTILPTAKASDNRNDVLRIAHIGDPQFGFGPRKPKEQFEINYVKHLQRFEQLITQVNALNPDIALISGDLTHCKEDITRDWPRLLKMFTVPVVITPGNHDTGIPVLRKNIERLRSVVGYDYKAIDIKGWRLIAGNTQYWYPTEEKELYEEYEAWVKEELKKAKDYHSRVIVAGHIPPFTYYLEEKDSYENCPTEKRIQRVKAYLEAGVRFFLSGHTHKMCIRKYKELAILTSETTCVNSDLSPYAFHMLEIESDLSYTWKEQYIK